MNGLRRANDTTEPVIVLTNVLRIREDDNPYLRLWNQAVTASGAELRFLDRPAVCTGRAPEWVHLQWPEWTVRDPSFRTASRELARLLLHLGVARVRGARVMVTVHNLAAHDGRHPRLESLLWRALSLLTTDLHVLSAAGRQDVLAEHPGLARATTHVIPHGNYAALAAGAPDRAAARRDLALTADARVLVTFGALRAYKGIEALLDAFAGVPEQDARLFVGGRLLDDRLRPRLDAATTDPRVSVRTDGLTDPELVRLIRAADAVVLPYERVLNSGSALLALTLGRPVLLPRTATFTELEKRLGAGWIALYDPPLSAADVLALRRTPDGQGPDLSWCRWDRITEQLAALWRGGRRGSSS